MMNIDFNDYEMSFTDAWDNLPDVNDLFETKSSKKSFIATEKKVDDKGFYAWWKRGGEIEKVSKDPFYDMYYFKRGA